MLEKQAYHRHRIVFFSCLIVVCEFVFFHILQYTADYLTATLMISFALLGLGAGGLAVSIIKKSENDLFLLCAGGCWVCLFLAPFNIIFLSFAVPVLIGLFFFQGLYLAAMFRDFDAHRIYWFDLCGAGLAPLFLAMAYMFLSSESIILGILALLAVMGLIAAARAPATRRAWVAFFLVLSIVSAALIIQNSFYHTFDLFRLSKGGTHSSKDKSFSGQGYRLIKSYDNLVSRVEVLTKNPGVFDVSYSGYLTDQFHKFPINAGRDARLVTGLVKDPHVYIVGPSAYGIIRLAKTMGGTIDGAEINPAIVRIMDRDFVSESADAYQGTNIRTANAMAQLKSDPGQYDIVTLINTHPTPRISYLGAPDFVHTREFYKVIFDHLSPQGYLMMEEKPWDGPGRYGLYREIRTLYQTLKDTGSPAPERHFFIYTYHLPGHPKYTGLLIGKNPLSSAAIVRIRQWAKAQENMDSVDFLADGRAGPYQTLFASIKVNRLKARYPGWDLSVLTDESPFPSAADPHTLEASQFLVWAGLAAILVLAMVGRHSMGRGPHPLLNLRFLFFQVCIGFAFIMIENTFMNVYQKDFRSPSWAFILTLSPLLVSSAIGGRFLVHKNRPWVIAVLVAACLALQRWLELSQFFFLPMFLKVPLTIASALACGLLMGFFFPAGMEAAKGCGLQMNTGHYFAVNCIAGAFAVVFSYYLFVHLGFSFAIFLAALLYLAAAFLLTGLGGDFKSREGRLPVVVH